MSAIGTDIEQISRVAAILQRTPRFAERLFTTAERDYCARQANPAQHYTARFCAKEAFAKAIGTPMNWHDVEIARSAEGVPSIITHGSAQELLAGRAVRLSMSHAGDYATATVLIEEMEQK